MNVCFEAYATIRVTFFDRQFSSITFRALSNKRSFVDTNVDEEATNRYTRWHTCVTRGTETTVDGASMSYSVGDQWYQIRHGESQGVTGSDARFDITSHKDPQ